ncbi:hypothetical protein [Leisingera sp. ANG-M1]|uniref:hypothetical protein n=1 Tax=Leisingera sp. ANG-M1 TaxID=1577895 RepID=UPI0012699548|nr:hypothetical protein [Leisingera sp. ANG-M1]
MSRKFSKTAFIALHPQLPSSVDQLSVAHEWCLRETKESGEPVDQLDVWFDDFRPGASFSRRSAGKQRSIACSIDQRELNPSSEVFFINPLCLGLSKEKAREVLQVIHGVGALVYVSDMGRAFGPNDDLGAFWAAHESQLEDALVA